MSDYCGYYDTQMNDGKVFDTDLNLLGGVERNNLTATEIAERNSWCEKIPGIKDHYKRAKRASNVLSLELMLQERVMVPNLVRCAVSTRSKYKEPRNGRRYPETVSPLVNFSQLVEGWVAPDLALDEDDFNIFKFSLHITSVNIALSDVEMEKVSGSITRSSLL